jgi:hypothetical protein
VDHCGEAPPRDEGEFVDGLLVGVGEVVAGRLGPSTPSRWNGCVKVTVRWSVRVVIGFASGGNLPALGQKSPADRT